jgi:hypothetical protein
MIYVPHETADGTDKMSEQCVGGPENKAEAAAYVAELTADLARIARRHGLDTLGYISRHGKA